MALPSFPLVYIVIFIFSAFIKAEIIDKTLESSSKINLLFPEFGFLTGGSLSLTINRTQQDDPLWFLFCSTEEIASIESRGIDPCEQQVNCTISHSLPNYLEYKKFRISENSYYSSYIINCQEVEFSVQAHVTLLNPGGDNLSSGNIPNPPMFFILLVVYGVFILLWVYNSFRFENRLPTLQRMVFLYLMVKAWYCYLEFRYWHTSSVSGTNSSSINMLLNWVIIVCDVLFFAVHLSIAAGIGYRRFTQLTIEKRYLIMSIAALLIARVLELFIHSFFFVLTFLVYIGIVYLMFLLINNTMNYFETEARENPRARTIDLISNRRNALEDNTMILASFKVIFLTFVSITVLIALIDLLFLRGSPWMSSLLRELLELMIMISVGYILRSRPAVQAFAMED